MGSLWWLGISLEIVSTMSGTVGKQLIRYSELSKFRNPKVSKTSYWVGIVVNTVCGPAIDMAAYSFAPQSLIAPFGGLDVVWNAMSAPYLLQERLTLRRMIGCLLILVGTATAGAVGSHEDQVYTVEYLEDLLNHERIPIYLGCFFVWYLFNVWCLQSRPRGSPVRGVSLGMTAGTIAGNMFCVKAAVEIIQHSINDGEADAWAHWLTYILLLGAVFFAVSNVRYMTQGLKEYEALFMVTVYEGSMIVSNCISGAVVLRDLTNLEAWRIALYWLSVVVIVVGMVVVFSNEMQNMSSLAAGKASIEPTAMKELQTKPHIALNIAGIGSAGLCQECTPRTTSPFGSPFGSPKASSDEGPPRLLSSEDCSPAKSTVEVHMQDIPELPSQGDKVIVSL